MKKKYVLYAFLFLIVEMVLVLFVDRPIAQTVRFYGEQHSGVIDFFRAYTDFGKSEWTLWPSGLIVIFCALKLRVNIMPAPLQEHGNKQPSSSFFHNKNKLRGLGEATLFFFFNIALSGIVTDLIKPFIGRARPVLDDREAIYGFHPISFHAAWNSMPSGHSTTAFAIALSLSYLFPRRRILFWAIGFAIALSRIMVSAHYPSDVLAGGIVSFITFLSLKHLWPRPFGKELRRRIFPIDTP